MIDWETYEDAGIYIPGCLGGDTEEGLAEYEALCQEEWDCDKIDIQLQEPWEGWHAVAAQQQQRKIWAAIMEEEAPASPQFNLPATYDDIPF